MESITVVASYIYVRYKELTEHEIDEFLLYRILLGLQKKYPELTFKDQPSNTADGIVFDQLVPMFRKYQLSVMPDDNSIKKNSILIDKTINEFI